MVDDLFDDAADGAFVLKLHVQPGAGRSAVVGRHGDALKVKVAAPPEQGRANEACVALVASILGVGEADVEIASGASSRSKRLRVTGLDREQFVQRLEVALEDAPLGGGNARSRRDVPRAPGR